MPIGIVDWGMTIWIADWRMTRLPIVDWRPRFGCPGWRPNQQWQSPILNPIGNPQSNRQSPIVNVNRQSPFVNP
jgi:hypothetical protein